MSRPQKTYPGLRSAIEGYLNWFRRGREAKVMVSVTGACARPIPQYQKRILWRLGGTPMLCTAQGRFSFSLQKEVNKYALVPQDLVQG